MEKRPTKDIDIKHGTIGTADIVALGAVVVSIIMALGIIFGAISGRDGALIIVPLLGAAGVAQIVKARRPGSKK